MGDSDAPDDGDGDGDELALLTQPGREEDLRTFLLLLHPADVAELVGETTEGSALAILSKLDSERAADLVSELDPADQERILRLIRPEQLGPIVEQMDTDDAVDLLQELDESTADRVLAQMPAAEQREVRQLLAYDPASAGGLMQTELVKVTLGCTVREAIEAARRQRDEVVQLYSIFVVDDVGRYAGQVALQDLLFATPETSIDTVMKPKPIEVNTSLHQAEVAKAFDRYSLVELGVVDDAGLLVGRITGDDVHEVLVEEHDEDVLKIAGTIGGSSQLESEGPLWHALRRLPWLAPLALGGVLAALLLEYTRADRPELSPYLAFLPLVVVFAGAVALQSATITIRGLDRGWIDPLHPTALWLKDLLVAVVMGAMVGVGVALFVAATGASLAVTLGVGGAVVLTTALASAVGGLEPLLAQRLGLDPTVAAGPLVTALAVMLGTAVHLFVAWWMIR